jgi:autotransporter translocation and assembly factor TamB
LQADSKLANLEQANLEQVALEQLKLAQVDHQLELKMRMCWNEELTWKTRKKIQPWTERQMPPIAF